MQLYSLVGLALFLCVLVLLFGLVPTIIIRNMKRSSRHDNDRFSSQLHIIELPTPQKQSHGKYTHISSFGSNKPSSAQRRFFNSVLLAQKRLREAGSTDNSITNSDDYVADGITPLITPAVIQFIRQQRKQHIRYRKIAILMLAIAIYCVAVVSFVLQAHYWLVAIPIAMFVGVLGIGAVARHRAVQWESELRVAQLAQLAMLEQSPESDSRSNANVTKAANISSKTHLKSRSKTLPITKMSQPQLSSDDETLQISATINKQTRQDGLTEQSSSRTYIARHNSERSISSLMYANVYSNSTTQLLPYMTCGLLMQPEYEGIQKAHDSIRLPLHKIRTAHLAKRKSTYADIQSSVLSNGSHNVQMSSFSSDMGSDTLLQQSPGALPYVGATIAFSEPEKMYLPYDPRVKKGLIAFSLGADCSQYRNVCTTNAMTTGEADACGIHSEVCGTAHNDVHYASGSVQHEPVADVFMSFHLDAPELQGPPSAEIISQKQVAVAKAKKIVEQQQSSSQSQ